MASLIHFTFKENLNIKEFRTQTKRFMKQFDLNKILQAGANFVV